MANLNAHYDFDRFAEYLCVTLADNAARCEHGLNKIQKIRVYTSKDKLWPTRFKVILDNELIASMQTHVNDDASHNIQYRYRCPSSIPFEANAGSRITNLFIEQAKSLDADFYREAWSFNIPGCLPFLLKELAYRNVTQNLAKQLQHQGIHTTDDFSVQFHDGENFLSFNYGNIAQQITQQIHFYLTDPKVKQLATDISFKHPQNKQWFMGLN
ncbi:hypothetical protein ACU6U9_15325 [Pseudomonas sp. HK3]